MTHDYGEVARRIEALAADAADVDAVLELLEARRARPAAERDAPAFDPGARPRLDSADDFDALVLRHAADPEGLDDIGRSEDRTFVSYCDSEFGNDYGESANLGAAMWAAFVRVLGQVPPRHD